MMMISIKRTFPVARYLPLLFVLTSSLANRFIKSMLRTEYELQGKFTSDCEAWYSEYIFSFFIYISKYLRLSSDFQHKFTRAEIW